jgi:hypothetical protein
MLAEDAVVDLKRSSGAEETVGYKSGKLLEGMREDGDSLGRRDTQWRGHDDRSAEALIETFRAIGN